MRLLLCTDLDRTLLPNGPQPESPLARKRFSLLAARDEVTLVYVTGRHQALVQQAIRNYQLPQPDFVIADVGSTIYQLRGDNWIHWQAWENEIASDWNNKTHDDLQLLLKQFSDLRVQEMSKQNTHKLSYYIPLYVDHSVLIEKIKHCFEQQNIHANLIWSVDEPANIGLLDILPASAGKRHAIEFLMQALDFDYD
ncbi:MAG: HAD-IIB family hydrolase, partial [Gammaproteobacteria bacterium]|nr:HAD-IIB family hydrolase [Gammaproteobacteria bacterium]